MVLIPFILLVTQAFGGDWHDSVPHRSGNKVILACHGEGSDRSIAMKIALDECRSLSTEFLNTSVNIRNLTVQTENSASYHSEVTSNQSVIGLECKINRKDEEQKDESFSIWLECEYDTSRAFAKNVSEDVQSKYVLSDMKSVTISTIPQCSEILVSGPKARKIDCHENTVTFVANPEDKEFIVRAPGFKPVHLTQLQTYTEIRFEK